MGKLSIYKANPYRHLNIPAGAFSYPATYIITHAYVGVDLIESTTNLIDT